MQTSTPDSVVVVRKAAVTVPSPQPAATRFDGRKSSEWARQARDRARWNVAVWKNAVAVESTPASTVPRIAPASVAVTAPSIPATSQTGSCFDQPYVPGWIVKRESGGDPTVINGGAHAASPYLSGGRSWGCAQFMPATWDANCRDLGYDVASQIECMRRVSNNGTNLGPWAL